MTYVGIDVSKKALHLAVLDGFEGEFPNTQAGHKKLVRELEDHTPCRVVLEATATYGDGIARRLAHTDGIDVMVANPRTTRHFALALDQRGKTDRIDSKMLARFGACMPFEPYKPPSKSYSELRRVTRRRRQLVAQRSEEKTRLREANAAVDLDPFVVEDIKAHIAHLQSRIDRMAERALEIIQANKDLHDWFQQLCTIDGVGQVTAMEVISELRHLIDDLDPKQLTAYAGLDPRPFDSGESRPRRRISKRGNKRLRTTLYLASWNAQRLCPEVRAWRQRLVERGKNEKLADVAVARKLLLAMHGMRRRNASWDPSKFNPRYQRDEAACA